jgi:hypothetical protein
MLARRLRRIFLIMSLFFLLSGHLSAQDSSSIDFQFWSDITLVHHFNDQWRFSGDQGVRGLFTNTNWTQVYVRPTFIWRFSAIMDARAGISIFQTWNKDIPNQSELRFHQETDIKWPYVAGFIFKHMIRFEERFFFNQGDENEFSFRMRYRPWMETPDFRFFSSMKKMYGIVSMDFFLPIGQSATEKFVNNYRLITGVGHRTSERLHMELHYFWQRSRSLTDEGFKTSENVLRFKLQLNEPPGN